MANTLRHRFVSTYPDGTDATLLRPSNWNDEHVFAVGPEGAVIAARTAASDKAAWSAAVFVERTVVDDYAGLHIAAPTGTPINAYGIYVEPQVGSTQAWNLYSAGAASKNAFDGRLRVGDPALAVWNDQARVNIVETSPSSQFSRALAVSAIGSSIVPPYPVVYAVAGDGETASDDEFYACYGGGFSASHYGDGYLLYLEGVSGWAYNGAAATVQNLTAVYAGAMAWGTSHTVTLAAVLARFGLYETATVLNEYGVLVMAPEVDPTSSVTNNYGLYIEPQLAGTTQSWNLYSAGATSKNRLEGRLYVGSGTDWFGAYPSDTFRSDNANGVWTEPIRTYEMAFTVGLRPSASVVGSGSYWSLFGTIETDVASTNAIGFLGGISGYATHYGSGVASTVAGAENAAFNSVTAGLISNLLGSLDKAYVQSNSVVTNASGVVAGAVVSTGTVTNAHAARLAVDITGGTVTNAYGVYISPVSGATTNNWNIFSAGATSKNRFEGRVIAGPTGDQDGWDYPDEYTNPNTFASYGDTTVYIVNTVTGPTDWGYGLTAWVTTLAADAANKGWLDGVTADVSHKGSGNSAGLQAGYFSAVAEGAGAVVPSVTGLWVNAESTGSVVTNLFGADFRVRSRNGGTTTNAYGVYVDGVTGATNNWNIFSAGDTSRNRQEGILLAGPDGNDTFGNPFLGYTNGRIRAWSRPDAAPSWGNHAIAGSVQWNDTRTLRTGSWFSGVIGDASTGPLATGNPGSLVGIYGFTDHYGSGDVTSAIAAGLFDAYNETSVSTGSVYGVSATATQYDSGSVPAVYGIHARAYNYYGTVTSLYGGRFTALAGADDVATTNAYGIYVDDVTGATNNWAIKTGTGKVAFGDRVEVGDLTTLDPWGDPYSTYLGKVFTLASGAATDSSLIGVNAVAQATVGGGSYSAVIGSYGTANTLSTDSSNYSGMWGVRGAVSHEGSGTSGVVGGIAGSGYISSGTITKHVGGLFTAWALGNSVATQTAGLRTEVHVMDTAAVTTLAGLYVLAAERLDSATVTNNYGVYIEDHHLVGSSAAYNLFSAGSDSKNKFEGDVDMLGDVVLGGGAVTYGANDSAGTGYRYVRVPNA